MESAIPSCRKPRMHLGGGQKWETVGEPREIADAQLGWVKGRRAQAQVVPAVTV
jgi:hypothetical protein